MLLYHCTPKRNLSSILESGLQPTRSQGKIKGVWMHTRSKTHWAILHTMKRHGLQSFSEVVILKCKIPRSKLTRRWRGLWTTDKVIRDFEVVDAAEYAASPLDTETERESTDGEKSARNGDLLSN